MHLRRVATLWLDDVHIGLNDNLPGAASGVYAWIDLRPAVATFTNWANNEPSSTNENCAVMDSNGAWRDFICGAIEASICKKRLLVVN